MINNLEEQIRLHTAGATVRHGAFEELQPYRNNFELTSEFIDTWVTPFYMRIGESDDEWIEHLEATSKQITKDVVVALLGDFNWRTRKTGAYFAAIKNYLDLIDIIGVHLLKSEVCFAGRVYCKALASFNTDASVDYIDRYLQYYLSQPDLWFDQRAAMAAISFLDKVNKTHKIDKHLNNWIHFIENKPNWSSEIETEYTEQQIKIIEYLREKDIL